MKVCPNKCDILASLEDKYCYKCGYELDSIADCICGRLLTKFDQYCPRCGLKVENLTIDNKSGQGDLKKN